MRFVRIPAEAGLIAAEGVQVAERGKEGDRERVCVHHRLDAHFRPGARLLFLAHEQWAKEWTALRTESGLPSR